MVLQKAFAWRLIIGSLAFHECIHVQYQADSAIAQNRGAGQQVLLSECLTEILNDDFLFAEQFIHQQTASGVAGLDHVNRPRTLTTSPRSWTVVTMPGRGRNDSRTDSVGMM